MPGVGIALGVGFVCLDILFGTYGSPSFFFVLSDLVRIGHIAIIIDVNILDYAFFNNQQLRS